MLVNRMKFKILLCVFFSLSVPNLFAYQEQLAVNLTLAARGNAYNNTANKRGKIRLTISSFEPEVIHGLFEWDNIFLYGKAVTCGKIKAKTSEGIEIVFKGTFDCSDIGGWPPDTMSQFEATIKWSKGSGQVKGAYRILGKDDLPGQSGVFDLAPLEKTKSKKLLQDEICNHNDKQGNSEPILFADIRKGTLNGARPDYTQEQLEFLFPDFSNELEWSDVPTMNGVLFDYLFKYFVIEDPRVRTSIKLLGKRRKKAVSKLGIPIKSGGEMYDAFQMEYGALILFYGDTIHDFMLSRKKKKKVKSISIHTTSVDRAIETICSNPEICR